MRVNIITHSLDKDRTGGVSRVCIDLANALTEKSIDVRLVSLGAVKEIVYKTNSEVSLITLDMNKTSTRNYEGFLKSIWFVESFREISALIKKSTKKEIWIFTSPPLCLLAGILKLRFNNHIFIAQEHTATTYSKGLSVDLLKNQLYKNIDAFIALTPTDCHYYEKNGLSATYIPNFIDQLKISKHQNKSPTNLLFVGRFSPEKQPLLALEIYKESKLFEKGIYFKMFGKGPLEKEILHYIATNNLEKWVSVITNESDADQIYKDGYALLLTSKIEGFGMVLIEALSRNIPCISFDAPYGPRSIIVNGLNGYLISPGDKKSFVKTLKGDAIDQLSSKNISNTVSKFSKDKVVNKWISLFEELLSAKQ